MSSKSNLKVSVSGVRGIVGEYLTPALIAKFAASFGEYVGGGRVVVGRDTRPTGEMLEKAVVAGLLSVGCQPVMLGIVPTPTVLITVDRIQANGGIAITASHNPAAWNALKFIGKSGLFLNHNEAAELLDIYNQPDTNYVPEADYRNLRDIDNAFVYHQQRIFDKIDISIIKKKQFKVAVDCCNGAGALYSVDFLEKLGCEVIPVFAEADGRFRRSPEPVAKNLTELSKTVVKNGCVLGFAQDPDADRIAMIDSKGKAVGEQYSVVLGAAHILSKTPGNVVVNLSTTKAVEDVVKREGREIFYSKIGEINVTGKMLEQRAVFGGEGSSGGVIWPVVHPCRDSFTAMALVLEMMAVRNQTFDKIMATLPIYVTHNQKLPCAAEKAQQIVRRLRKKYASQHPRILDGLRIDWDDAWVLIRPSNTEPVMRISTEAPTLEKAENLAAEFALEISD